MIKKGKSILKGFTLIELMVVITIGGILAVGVSNINWNRLTDRQKVTIFQNRVVSEIETIRNNALFGKGVGIDLVVPDRWRVDIGYSDINILYQTGSNDFVSYDSFDFQPRENIANIYCGTDLVPQTQTGMVLIEGSEVTLTGASVCGNQKSIFMDLRYNGFSGSIEFNSINGLIGNTQ